MRAWHAPGNLRNPSLRSLSERRRSHGHGLSKRHEGPSPAGSPSQRKEGPVMLRSIKDMLDYTILATDGEIGQVSDILLGRLGPQGALRGGGDGPLAFRSQSAPL